MLVSAVIPTYNRAKVIGETLDSVLAQTWAPIEIIVVDDGSTDGTEQAVERFRDRITYIRQPNAGLAAARNAGMARATGGYVAWLDSDDTWEPEKIALQVAFMEKYPEYVLCATDFSAFDEHGYFERSYASRYYSVLSRTPGGLAGIFPEHWTFDSLTVYGGRIYEHLVDGNCLHPPSVLIRREAVLKAGNLDGQFGSASDLEYLIRLSRLGPIAYLDRPLMRYRLSQDQMSSNKNLAGVALSCLRVLEHLKQQDPSLLERSPLKQRLAFWHLTAAHALVGSQRIEAARHLLTSISLGHVSSYTARGLVKLFLPRRS